MALGKRPQALQVPGRKLPDGFSGEYGSRTDLFALLEANI